MKYCPKCGVELRERRMDGVDRLACSTVECTFVHWDNPTPVVAGLVRWQNQFVLARNVKWPSGIFSMITGFLERNETPEQALEREMKEELGLDLAGCTFIAHYSFSPANQLILAFLAEGVGSLQAGSDIVEAKVLARDELANFDFGQLELTATVVRDGLLLASKRVLQADDHRR
jgi:NAD+ diphosphatase